MNESVKQKEEGKGEGEEEEDRRVGAESHGDRMSNDYYKTHDTLRLEHPGQKQEMPVLRWHAKFIVHDGLICCHTD